MSVPQKLFVAILICSIITGCATVRKDAGFADVKKSTGLPVQWRGNTIDDAAADSAVQKLLQHELSLDDVVQITLLNNLNLQATYQDLGIAQADLVQAGLLNNPVLSAERRFNGQAAEIDVMQDFLDLLALPMRKKVAAAQFEAAKLRVGQQVIDIISDVRIAFYTLQADQQSLELRQNVVASTEADATAATKMHDAGNISILELSNHQKLAAQAKLDLAMAQDQLAQDRERLNVLMGLGGSDIDWKLAAHLPDLPGKDVPLENLESQAIAQRLDLAEQKQQIEADAKSLGITDTFRYVPAISVGVHYEHEIEPKHSIGPGIEVGLPIFDQGQAASARGRAVLKQAQLKYAAMAIEIDSQVRSSYNRMKFARQRAENLKNNILPLDQQILDQTQLQYNGMYTGVFGLLQAQQSQIDTRNQYVQTLRDYWIARAQLQQAIGGRFHGDQP